MRQYFLVLFSLLVNYSQSQELLLVIDEQFANKTFDSFSDVLYQNVPGDLHYTFDGGVVGEGGFGYRDTLADLDGTGVKPWHYQYTQDDLIFFPRKENFYTTNSGLSMEANGHGEHGGVETMSGAVLIYPWTFKQGYFEIKAKLPSGTGIMSSWFFFDTRGNLGYGCGDNYPDGNGVDINWQEVDVWETNGHWPTRLRNNIHWSGYLPDPTFQCQNSESELICNEKCQNSFEGVDGTTEIDFTSDFHTFGMYWDQKFIILFIDGLVYRYWTKPEPILKQNGYPDPLIFLDAMIMYVGTGYGTQHDDYISGFPRTGDNPDSPLKDQYDTSDNLYGPDPRLPIPSSKLEVEYFRYWVFVPCEDQDSLIFFQSNQYYNQKNITNYNSVNYGHYETGRNISCESTYIGPTVNPNSPAEEYPFKYSDQLNLIASETINLKPGFHAKSAAYNFPIESQFHAKIQTCATIPTSQPMPFIHNLGQSSYITSFWGDFQYSLDNMIDESWGNDGPLKLSENMTDSSSFDVIKDFSLFETNENILIEIYPNPFHDYLSVQSDINMNGILEYQIHNTVGDIVLFGTLKTGSDGIATSSLSSGIYFLTIICNEEKMIFKVVK